MCNPSLEPGGVSSAAEADALAEAEAECEAETESFADGAYRPDQALAAKGLVYEIVVELSLLSELADAEMLGLC